MVYLLIIALLALILIINHKQLGLAMILVVAMATVCKIIVPGLSQVLISSGLNLKSAVLTKIITIVLVIIPSLIVIYRSHRRARSIIRIVFESVVFVSLILSLIGSEINSLIKVDYLSLEIYQFITNYHQIILVLAIVLGFWQIVVKDEE